MIEQDKHRELDAGVAEYVMGYGKLQDWYWRPAFSTNIKHAWSVMEKMQDAWLPSIYHDGQLWVCEFYDGKRKVIASALTAPEAICLAALASVEDE